MVKFKVIAPITGKARPRVTRYGTFTPKKTKDYQKLVALECQSATDNYYECEALRCDIKVFCEVPKSYTKKRRKACLSTEEYPTKKPDVDNIMKIVQDALNGVLYKDDSQIIEASITKQYTDQKSYIEVKFYVIGG